MFAVFKYNHAFSKVEKAFDWIYKTFLPLQLLKVTVHPVKRETMKDIFTVRHAIRSSCDWFEKCEKNCYYATSC